MGFVTVQVRFYLLLALQLLSMVAIYVNFIRLVLKESRRVVFARVQILNMRIAGLLPLYGIVFILKYVFYEFNTIIDTGGALFEGYCIYCFFKMQLFYIGSRVNVLEALRQSKQKFLFCTGLERKYPEMFLRVGNGLLLQFLFIRPLIVLVQGLLQDSPMSSVNSIFPIFTILQLVSTVLGLIALLRLALILAHHTRRLCALRKLLYLKLVVLGVIIETLLCNLLVLKSGSATKAEIIIRAYAVIVMVELLAASCCLQRVFLSDTHLLVPVPDTPSAVLDEKEEDEVEDLTAKETGPPAWRPHDASHTRASINLTTESENHAVYSALAAHSPIRDANPQPPRAAPVTWREQLWFLLQVCNLLLYVFEDVDAAQPEGAHQRSASLVESLRLNLSVGIGNNSGGPSDSRRTSVDTGVGGSDRAVALLPLHQQVPVTVSSKSDRSVQPALANQLLDLEGDGDEAQLLEAGVRHKPAPAQK